MKRKVCVLLTLALLVQLCVVTASAAKFFDVSDSFRAREDIEYVVG